MVYVLGVVALSLGVAVLWWLSDRFTPFRFLADWLYYNGGVDPVESAMLTSDDMHKERKAAAKRKGDDSWSG